jgi:hypothetical protein
MLLVMRPLKFFRRAIGPICILLFLVDLAFILGDNLIGDEGVRHITRANWFMLTRVSLSTTQT